jgi:hypothetical protein
MLLRSGKNTSGTSVQKKKKAKIPVSSKKQFISEVQKANGVNLKVSRKKIENDAMNSFITSENNFLNMLTTALVNGPKTGTNYGDFLKNLKELYFNSLRLINNDKLNEIINTLEEFIEKYEGVNAQLKRKMTKDFKNSKLGNIISELKKFRISSPQNQIEDDEKDEKVSSYKYSSEEEESDYNSEDDSHTIKLGEASSNINESDEDEEEKEEFQENKEVKEKEEKEQNNKKKKDDEKKVNIRVSQDNQPFISKLKNFALSAGTGAVDQVALGTIGIRLKEFADIGKTISKLFTKDEQQNWNQGHARAQIPEKDSCHLFECFLYNIRNESNFENSCQSLLLKRAHEVSVLFDDQKSILPFPLTEKNLNIEINKLEKNSSIRNIMTKLIQRKIKDKAIEKLSSDNYDDKILKNTINTFKYVVENTEKVRPTPYYNIYHDSEWSELTLKENFDSDSVVYEYFSSIGLNILFSFWKGDESKFSAFSSFYYDMLFRIYLINPNYLESTLRYGPYTSLKYLNIKPSAFLTADKINNNILNFISFVIYGKDQNEPKYTFPRNYPPWSDAFISPCLNREARKLAFSKLMTSIRSPYSTNLNTFWRTVGKDYKDAQKIFSEKIPHGILSDIYRNLFALRCNEKESLFDEFIFSDIDKASKVNFRRGNQRKDNILLYYYFHHLMKLFEFYESSKGQINEHLLIELILSITIHLERFFIEYHLSSSYTSKAIADSLMTKLLRNLISFLHSKLDIIISIIDDFLKNYQKTIDKKGNIKSLFSFAEVMVREFEKTSIIDIAEADKELLDESIEKLMAKNDYITTILQEDSNLVNDYVEKEVLTKSKIVNTSIGSMYEMRYNDEQLLRVAKSIQVRYILDCFQNSFYFIYAFGSRINYDTKDITDFYYLYSNMVRTRKDVPYLKTIFSPSEYIYDPKGTKNNFKLTSSDSLCYDPLSLFYENLAFILMQEGPEFKGVLGRNYLFETFSSKILSFSEQNSSSILSSSDYVSFIPYEIEIEDDKSHKLDDDEKKEAKSNDDKSEQYERPRASNVPHRDDMS